MIRDTLAKGLGDRDIQLALLGDQTQTEMSLEDTIRFVEVKEASKRSARALDQSQRVAVAGARQPVSASQDSATATPAPGAASSGDTCQYCGRTGHGTGTRAPPKGPIL